MIFVNTPIRLDVDGAYGDTGFAQRLAALSGPPGKPDSYGEGEEVAACEAALARLLGKERALLFATGTLANLVALSRHCGRQSRRVLVHPESHVHRDAGDSLSAVMGLTAVEATAAGAGFEAAEVDRAVAEAVGGKVPQGLGAIVIETPVRRRANEMFPPEMLADVIAAAGRNGVPLHLDGARLPIAAAAVGQTMAATAAPFDTVYLSLWKMFGMPFGAVLAGPAAFMDGADLDRRRYGGALPQLWPIARVVTAEIGRIEPGWAAALRWKHRLREALAGGDALSWQPVGAAETNSFRLCPAGGDAGGFRRRCAEAGIVLGDVQGGTVVARANPGIAETDAAEVARTLIRASGT